MKQKQQKANAAPSSEKKMSLNVRGISSNVVRADTSRQLEPMNEFTNGASAVGSAIITPPYDPITIDKLFSESNIIPQCVDAMVTNVSMYGWEIVQASPDTEIDENERQELQSFIDRANSDESLTTVHANLVHDFEKFGYGFVEFIRDRAGKVSIIRHAKSSITRLLPKHPDSVMVVYDVVRGKRTSNVVEFKKFRRYVQIVFGETVYFKEFGDPRRMSYKSGQYASQENQIPDDELATELLHFRQKSEDAYGMPRWANQLPSIMGSRESEIVNYRYFKDNTVPAMMLLASGGRITTQSYNELTKLLNEGIGSDRQNKILLVEAVPESTSLDDKGTVDLKIEKLTDARQSDGLFKEYDDSNSAKVLSSFRLGAILVGRSGDHQWATAQTAQFIAETQVFEPARSVFDEIYNNRFVSSPHGLGLKTVLLHSKAPSITNPESIVKSLTAGNVMGAVTPRASINMLNKVLQIELPQYPEKGEEGYDEWMDTPIQLTVANKNQDLQSATSVKDKEIQNPDSATGVGVNKPKHGQE